MDTRQPVRFAGQTSALALSRVLVDSFLAHSIRIMSVHQKEYSVEDPSVTSQVTHKLEINKHFEGSCELLRFDAFALPELLL